MVCFVCGQCDRFLTESSLDDPFDSEVIHQQSIKYSVDDHFIKLNISENRRKKNFFIST